MYATFKYTKRKLHERAQRNGQTTAGDGPFTESESSAILTGENVTPSIAEMAIGNNDMVYSQSAHKKKQKRKYRWKILFGLCAPFALQALDTTIIASAFHFIAADFGETKQVNWIISSFNLTAAAFLPFWAQITDIFGRHVTIHTVIVIMMVGSAICTGAPTSSFGVLLFGRALQGVGAAGVNISVHTILADRVSLNDFAFNWTIFGLLAGISFGVGPVLGGFLTEANWRWCFAINLPVAVIAIVLVIVLLRGELLGPQPLPELENQRDVSTRHGRFLARIATIDYGGQLLFLWGVGLLVLALTWGGSTYPWNSVAVLVTLILGSVLTFAWVLYEYLMAPPGVMSRIFPFQRAMMPWDLLTQRDVGLIFLLNFAVGMAMFSVLYFMNIYFTEVQGHSAGKAGLSLLYYLPGLGVGVYMAMFTSNVWPRQTLLGLVFGSVASAVGITVLGRAVDTGNLNLIYAMMALTGFGVGMRLNPGTVHGLAYFPTRTAVITCMVTFAMPFGGTVALTFMFSVFNNKTGPEKDDIKSAVSWAFVSLMPFMWLCVVLSTFLGNVWILKDGGHEVVNEPYLWSLVTGRKLVRERKTRGETDADVPLTTIQGKRLAVAEGPKRMGRFSSQAEV